MRTSLTARWVDTRVPVDVDVLERTPGLRDPRQAGLAIMTYKNGVGETKEAVGRRASDILRQVPRF